MHKEYMALINCNKNIFIEWQREVDIVKNVEHKLI